jgi:2'-5' RNA ligase
VQIAAHARRTALAIVVSEAEQVVAAFRRLFDPAAERIPAHVTILVPFVPAISLDERAVDGARAHFAELPAFDAALTGISTFDAHVWLSPEPTARFVELINATYARFPAFPPYGGVFLEPVPHLTIGQADGARTLAEIRSAADAEIAHRLPVSFRVDMVSLFVEQGDARWSRRADLPLRS